MNGDVIKLVIPAKPDYILAVRLAVSAVAERAGFDIENIEDIKVAAAEACTLLIESCDTIDIDITVKNGLEIRLNAAGNIKTAAAGSGNDETADLSRYLLEALVDNCVFSRREGGLMSVSFYKKI